MTRIIVTGCQKWYWKFKVKETASKPTLLTWLMSANMSEPMKVTSSNSSDLKRPLKRLRRHLKQNRTSRWREIPPTSSWEASPKSNSSNPSISSFKNMFFVQVIYISFRMQITWNQSSCRQGQNSRKMQFLSLFRIAWQPSQDSGLHAEESADRKATRNKSTAKDK